MVAIRAIGIGAAASLAAALPSDAQQVVDLYGVTEATLQWSAAAGQVAGYYVIVSHNGGTPSVYGVSTDTQETVKAPIGDTVTVQVAAFDGAGVAGPVSAPSDAIRFNRALETPPPTTPPPSTTPPADPDPTPPPPADPGPGETPGGNGSLVAVRMDYTGDGRSDVLLRNPKDGKLTLWAMQGAQVTRQAAVASLPYPWIAEAAGDFDGDGQSDILWRNDGTGQLSVALVRNGAMVGGGALTLANFKLTRTWKVDGIGDFDGDGHEDIALARRNQGLLEILYMDGAAVASHATLKAPSADWHLVATPDADGDGIAELVWENVNTHELRIESLAAPGTTLPLLAAKTPWRVIGSGDVNGDGRGDLLLSNKDTRLVAPLLLAGAHATLASFGLTPADSSWQLRGVGDFDADGRADALWSHPSGTIEIWFGGDAAFRTARLTSSSGGLLVVGEDED